MKITIAYITGRLRTVIIYDKMASMINSTKKE
jgi:hypothetical protein